MVCSLGIAFSFLLCTVGGVKGWSLPGVQMQQPQQHQQLHYSPSFLRRPSFRHQRPRQLPLNSAVDGGDVAEVISNDDGDAAAVEAAAAAAMAVGGAEEAAPAAEEEVPVKRKRGRPKKTESEKAASSKKKAPAKKRLTRAQQEEVDMNRLIQPTTLAIVTAGPFPGAEEAGQPGDAAVLNSIKTRCQDLFGEALRIEHSVLEFEEEVADKNEVEDDEDGLVEEQPAHDDQLVSQPRERERERKRERETYVLLDQAHQSACQQARRWLACVPSAIACPSENSALSVLIFFVSFPCSWKCGSRHPPESAD